MRQSLASLQGENAWARTAIHANRWLSRLPDRIVFNSRASIGQHRAFGFAAGNALFLPNGFDGERFRPDAAARALRRREWGFDDRHVVFGMLARLHPAKGHVDFLQAARRLLDTRPEARFVIAGPDHDGRGATLAELVQALGLSDSVRLLVGHHPAPGLLPGLDVLVSGSTAVEGFSNAIGEALCCGVPCVATSVGDSAWVVGDAGIVVQPAAPDALAAAMDAMVDHGTTARHAMGARGRERVLRDFGLEAVAAQFGALWSELARSAPRGAEAA